MNDSDGKIHYDYMTVRANDISECGHYSAFGWIYIADDSERGGRYSFRRISCPSVQAKLDSMQNECEKLLLKIRKIGDKAPPSENLRLNSQNSMMMYFSVRYGVERINSL